MTYSITPPANPDTKRVQAKARVFTSPVLFNRYADTLEAKKVMFLMSVHSSPRGKDFWTIRTNY